MNNFYHGGGNGVSAYNGNNHESGNFTPERHIGVGNFFPHARSYEHNSYDCYEGNRLGARNGYMIDHMRDSIKIRGNVERCDRSYDNYEHSYGSKNMYNEHNDKVLKLRELHQDLLVTTI
ncbi:hypothetical protein M9H77_12785 [Catharanthus roseus]|uniref:Uncharacterized protein n=1 Tax=Catharanthus roseus TaxID=4058 RepID=A0ACC0BID4_CATRO|nr:hypothetical protein M9H77_12785 [Catharanthus roseus]